MNDVDSFDERARSRRPSRATDGRRRSRTSGAGGAPAARARRLARARRRARPWRLALPCAVRSGHGGCRAAPRFVPSVRVAAVQASGGHLVVSLPGTTSAFAAANIFARASGYIEKRNVDIGDRVKAGQLLAKIVAPELDHQISQAEATLAQLRATLQQAQANPRAGARDLGRDRPLVEKGWLPPQQGDIDG